MENHNDTFCYYIPEIQDPVQHGGYVPSVVDKDEPGHCPLLGQGEFASPWMWGETLEKAQEVCKVKNERLGLSSKEVDEIVASSMRI